MPQTSFDGVQAILAQATSETLCGPGRTNIYLSSIIRELQKKLDVPVCAQGEVAQCLQDLPLVGTIPRQCNALSYFTTRDVAMYQKGICDANNWNCVIVVSSKRHLWRAVMTTRTLGLDVRIPWIPEYMWEPQSIQWHNRNAYLGIPSETLQRIKYVLKGWIR